MSEHDLTILRRAAAAAVKSAGGPAALGKAMGLRRSTVHDWTTTGGIPAARVPAVSRLTGIPLHELRPDLFDAPQAAKAEAA
jgi:DNA-binding transcriptional regulator YdaS (Cro superfamily)